ncbi:MAG: tripartite tricarboxylate transporter permease, partial [Isosphaeraceae bacterium]
DSVTAIVIGVLLMKNIKPGPEIFLKQADLVYALYILFILANLVLLPVGLLAIKAGGYVIRVPRRVLLPVILLFCVLGSYAINSRAFDVWVMLGMGVLGLVFERRRIPLGPVVLGIILGGPLEERFIQTLTGAGGSPLAFVDRPLAAVLAALWLGLWISMIVMRRRPTLPGVGPEHDNKSSDETVIT